MEVILIITINIIISVVSTAKGDKKIIIRWNMEELRTNGQIKDSVVINIDGI